METKYSIVKIFILNKRLQFETKIFGEKIKSSHFYDQFRQINRVGVNHSTNHLLSQQIFFLSNRNKFHCNHGER